VNPEFSGASRSKIKDAPDAVLDGAEIGNSNPAGVAGEAAFVNRAKLIADGHRAGSGRSGGDDDRRMRFGAGRERHDNDGSPGAIERICGDHDRRAALPDFSKSKPPSRRWGYALSSMWRGPPEHA
jgi:hypothetical protein